MAGAGGAGGAGGARGRFDKQLSNLQSRDTQGGDSRKVSVDLGSEDKFIVKGGAGTRTIVLRQILQHFGDFISFVL